MGAIPGFSKVEVLFLMFCYREYLQLTMKPPG